MATAPIRPLAWDPPYATGAAPEKAKRQKTKQKKNQKKTNFTRRFGQQSPLFGSPAVVGLLLLNLSKAVSSINPFNEYLPSAFEETSHHFLNLR